MVTARSFTNSSTGMKTLKARECALLISVPSMPCGVKRCAMCMCVCAKSLQPCLTLCDPMNCSLPGSSVQGIFQARILEWVAMPSSKGSSWPRDQTSISYVSPVLAGRFFTTSAPWEACAPYYLLNKWADEWVDSLLHFHVTFSNCNDMFLWEPPPPTN